MLAGGAFMALWLLLFAEVSAEPVSPPTNVTVMCQNMQASVGWDYGQDEVPTRFLVYVGSSHRERRHLQVVTEEHKYDNVSALVWDSLESAMDVHYVTLTAAQGGHFSTNVSKTFTFNHLKLADVTCKLDFPPVDVRVDDSRTDDLGTDDSRTVVSFPNPLHYYPKMSWATRMEAVHLDVIVSRHGSQGDVKESCQTEHKTCRVGMSFPKGADQCVTLTGSMHDQAGRYVAFQKTAPVCLYQSNALETKVLAVLLLGLLAIIIVIAVIIWKVRAWTMQITKEDLPKSLVPGHILSKGECNLDPNCIVELVSTVEEVRLISQSDTDSSGESTSTESVPSHPEEEEQVEDEHEEEVEEEFFYDRTHVDLGDGDAAMGYTERRR